MSLLSSLYIGNSGLNVSQTALNTTAHNLANVDTKGFVRQQVLLTDKMYLKLGETYISPMQQGLGAEFATVRQVRDNFLDMAYRQEIGRQAFYDSQYLAISEMEGLFGELEGVSFQNTMEEFWISLQELAKEPDNIAARESFIQTSVTFIERAENISKQLKDYQINLNTEIEKQVTRINEIGNELLDLNIKIRRYESAGVEKANDLRDQRNLLLDELGRMVKISYKENMDTTVSVQVEGVSFVNDDIVYPMGIEKAEEGTSMVKPVWITHGYTDVFNMDVVPSAADNTDIGSLKALITARGTRQGRYTDIPASNPESYPSKEAYENAVRKYNSEINPSVIMTVQAQFDKLIHGIVTTINDIICPNRQVELTDGSKIFIMDVPDGMDPDDFPGEGLFNRKSMDRYRETQEITIVENGVSRTIEARIYNEEDAEDNYSLFTLGEVEVNPVILQDYSKLNLTSASGSGDYDMEKIEKLLAAWQASSHTLSPNTLTKHSFNEFYNGMISELANRGEQAVNISATQASMVESIDNQRMQVTGVSSDEELTNLIKFQHAYNAAARYINVVSEMLEHLVTRL